jgi:hypothetical protein
LKDEVLTYAQKKLAELQEQAIEVKGPYIEDEAGGKSSVELYIPLASIVELLRRAFPVAERMMVINDNPELEKRLKEGWLFDPWLCPRGHPVLLGDNGHYWVLVKGTPEEIAKLNPFIELPTDEEEETKGREPVGYATIILEHTDTPPEVPEGFVILHDKHIFARGTVYTKTSKDDVNQ